MLDPKTLDDLVARIWRVLPPGLDQVRADLNRNLRATLSAALEKAELVTREEFDVQSGVLARTRERLQALEQQVASLEREVLRRPGPPPGDRPAAPARKKRAASPTTSRRRTKTKTDAPQGQAE